MGSNNILRALEGWVRDELRGYALALRKLAYSLPNGVGEHALLELSDQMNAAGRNLAGMFGSFVTEGPMESQSLHTRASPTIDEIRRLIPEWPDTNGIPWQMCVLCSLVYDPTRFHAHARCQRDDQHRGRCALRAWKKSRS